MNENIDLTKILDGCPGGIGFYSIVYGKVRFVKLDSNALYPILMEDDFNGRWIYFTKDGRSVYNWGECTLFPSKDQRDWSKFVRFWDKQKVEKFDVDNLQPFDKVLVRDFVSDNWMADFFERIDESDVYYNVDCVVSHWIQCIPYNEETKHLLGTKEECPEYYKWWEE